MKSTDMKDYMKQELWVDRVRETILHWEMIQGIEVSDKIRESIVDFMRGKIKNGIRKNSLMRTFLQIAVTSLLYIKIKGIK